MLAASPVPVRTARRSLIRVAGALYAGAWIAGLIIAPGNTDVDSSGLDLLHAYAGRTESGLLQAILVHGLAGVLLAIVVRGVAGRSVHSRAVLGFGFAAAGLSLVQCALEFALFGKAIPAGDAGATHALYLLVAHLDGAKMLALAGLVLAVAGAGWLRPLGLLLALSITVSGIGYLFVMPSLATAAYVSLPCLLLWVAATAAKVRS